MQHAANAYAKVAKTTQSGRELEAAVLMNAATRLQGIRENWDKRQGELGDALTYNRKLWTVLVTSVTRPENPLPQPIKHNIMTLGMFIFSHTLDVLIEPEPERLGVLININRELAAGLRASDAA
jgi:flagellar protein FlaF